VRAFYGQRSEGLSDADVRTFVVCPHRHEGQFFTVLCGCLLCTAPYCNCNLLSLSYDFACGKTMFHCDMFCHISRQIWPKKLVCFVWTQVVLYLVILLEKIVSSKFTITIQCKCCSRHLLFDAELYFGLGLMGLVRFRSVLGRHLIKVLGRIRAQIAELIERSGHMKRLLVVQNLKIAENSVLIFSKLFDCHSSGGNVSMKENN